MHRIMIKKFLIRTSIILLISLGALLVLNFYTDTATARDQQTKLHASLSQILKASYYEEYGVQKYRTNYETIQSFYGGYDAEGILVGYVLEIELKDNPYFSSARMAFARDGSTINSLVLLPKDNPEDTSAVLQEFLPFEAQFKDIRVPVALDIDLNEQMHESIIYPPIEGLVDGDYRVENRESSEDRNYTDFVQITVNGGRITKVTWDGEAKEGGKSRKEASIDGEYSIGKDQLSWAEQAYKMETLLVELQDPDRIPIKSDGTTGVIDQVKMNVNTFMTLSKACIELAKNPGSPTVAPEQIEPEGAEEQNEPAMITTAPEVTEVPTARPIDRQTQEGLNNFSGGEDGVVDKNESSMLSQNIDGLSISEIRTRVTTLNAYPGACRQVVSAVNQAYIFLTDYLKGGG